MRQHLSRVSRLDKRAKGEPCGDPGVRSLSILRHFPRGPSPRGSRLRKRRESTGTPSAEIYPSVFANRASRSRAYLRRRQREHRESGSCVTSRKSPATFHAMNYALYPTFPPLRSRSASSETPCRIPSRGTTLTSHFVNRYK